MKKISLVTKNLASILGQEIGGGHNLTADERLYVDDTGWLVGMHHVLVETLEEALEAIIRPDTNSEGVAQSINTTLKLANQKAP